MGNDSRDKFEVYRQARAEKSRRNFEYFIRQVSPKYEFNWHHLVLIDALQRLAERRYKRLIVTMPPRHGKSELVSVLFPAWCFARNQSEHLIIASYAFDLASRMNRECQRIIDSDSYRQLFPNVTFAKESEPGSIRTNQRFDIAGGGHYVSAGVGGGITGVGATIAIIDDPVKDAMEADSLTYRDRAWEWYTTTFTTRFERGAIEVICQTRWHEDDLTGRILERKKHGTEVINLPAICEKPEPHREIGEALWPAWYSREWLLEKQSENGSRAWNALYQQRPAPDEGSTIKRQWFQYYDPRQYKIEGKKVNYYFDTAYTKNEKNDPTAGIAYVREGADLYVLECASEWLDFGEQKRFIKDFSARNGYSPLSIIRIEPKATGISLVQEIKQGTALNVKEGETVKGDKPARVNRCEGILEAGRVHLPKGMAWTAQFLDECAAFPNAAHDDRVDCLTGMIINEFLISKPKQGIYSVYTS